MKAFVLHSLIIMSMLIAGFGFPGAVFSLDEESDDMVLDVEGSALIKNHDLSRTRDTALQSALQKAVEQVVGRLLTPKVVEERMKVLKGAIFSKTEEYIGNYRIISEKAFDDLYTVNVKATVMVAGLRRDLLDNGLLKEKRKTAQTLPLQVTLRGVKSYADYVMVREFIRAGIKGVDEVHQRSVEWGTAMMELTIQGGAKALMAELARLKQSPIQARITEDGAVEATLIR